MAELPDPPRWTVRPLQGWAGCWPPLVVGHDCFHRLTITLIIPATCTITVAFVPPDLGELWHSLPWRTRRWWWDHIIREDHLDQ